MPKKYFNVDLETSGKVVGSDLEATSTVVGSDLEASVKVVSPVVAPPSSQSLLVKGDKRGLDGDNMYTTVISSDGGAWFNQPDVSANITLVSTDKDNIRNPVSAPDVISNAESSIIISSVANYGDTDYDNSSAGVALVAQARKSDADSDHMLKVEEDRVVIDALASSQTPTLVLGQATFTQQGNNVVLDRDLDLGSSELSAQQISGRDLVLTDTNTNLSSGPSISIGPNGGHITASNGSQLSNDAVIKRTPVDAVNYPHWQNLSIGEDLNTLTERTIVGGKGLEASKLFSSDMSFWYGSLSSDHVAGQDVQDGGQLSLVGIVTSSSQTGELVTVGNIGSVPSEYSTDANNDQYLLMYGEDNKLYRGTYSYFSAEHTYISDEELEVGSAAVISNGKITVSQSSNESICVGIVSSSRVIDSNTVDNRDSLGNLDAAEGLYLCRVICTGDSRHKGCQGFNVCNENGDIQPGDLLVTSSTPGYLMKQGDDIIRSKTVGKAMEQVTFDDNGQATGVYGFIYCG